MLDDDEVFMSHMLSVVVCFRVSQNRLKDGVDEMSHIIRVSKGWLN